MNSVQAETYLAILYLTGAILSLISTICIVTTWQYWTWTLNVCIDVNCGCILYSVNTFSKFMGGDVKICHFASYAAIPTMLCGLIFGLYHGYRTCIDKKLSDPKIIASRPIYYNRADANHRDVVIVNPKRRAPCKHWMPATFLAALIFCLSLSHAVVITDGYYKTCEQYRKNLIKMLGSIGREAEAIYKRLSCGSIFDYMDYMEPDVSSWRNNDKINTGLALQCTIISIWVNCFVWITIFFINFIMNRKKKISQANDGLCGANN